MGKTLDFTVSCGLAPTGGELRNTQYQPQLQKTVSFSSVAPPLSFWDLLDFSCAVSLHFQTVESPRLDAQSRLLKDKQ